MSIASLWERFYPAIAGLVIAVAAFSLGGYLIDSDISQALKRLYSVLMNVSAIYTGFLCNLLFTLHFGSTITLDKVRNTRSFQVYIRYVHEAFVLGFVAALASVPMVVLEPVPTSEFNWERGLFSFWTGSMIWSLVAAFRVGQTYLSLRHR